MYISVVKQQLEYPVEIDIWSECTQFYVDKLENV